MRFVMPALGIMLMLMFLTSACIPPEAEQRKQKQEVQRETSFKRCLDTGGIPVTSIWDGRLTNCIFPPKEP